MTLRVIFCDPSTDPAPWLECLRAHLPAAQVQAWTEDAEPADYAVVWGPPQRLVDQQPRLKAVFNVGAGVDRLFKLQLPRGLRIVRLDDAGMGVQMAEYVCHAVSRHYREFAAYEAQAAQAAWTPRRIRPRAGFGVGILGLGVLGRRGLLLSAHASPFGAPL